MEGFDLSFVPALYKPSSLLPIAKHRESLLYTVEKFPVTVVVGQTGSGKTTQLPQFLEQAGWCADGKVIGVTQVGFVRLATLETKQASNFLFVAKTGSCYDCCCKSRRGDAMSGWGGGRLFNQV
jgi:ATP-dependent RNA helicase DDX35